MGFIIIGIVLIALQIISLLGNLASGNFYLFSNPSNLYVVLYDLARLFGYFAVGLLGVVFLLIGIRFRKKRSMPSKHECDEIHCAAEKTPYKTEVAQSIVKKNTENLIKRISLFLSELKKKDYKSAFKKTSNFMSSHIKLIAILFLACAVVNVISLICYASYDTKMSEAYYHYEETETSGYLGRTVGCGYESCQYCQGTIKSYSVNYSPYIFGYYNTVSDAVTVFEGIAVISALVAVVLLVALIVGATNRYKFVFLIKERNNT